MATIKKRNGSYLIRVSNGYDTEGKQITKSMTWKIPQGMSEKKAEKEAQRQAILFEEQVRNGFVLDGKIRFKDFANKWMKEYAEIQLRPRTVERYKELLVRINNSIGHFQLEKIQPFHLIQFYNSLREVETGVTFKIKIDFKSYLKSNNMTKKQVAELSGVSDYVINSLTSNRNISKDSAEKICEVLGIDAEKIFEVVEGHTLSDKTILHYHRLTSSILSWAVKWQVIPINPASRVQSPKVARKEAVFLDDEQAKMMLERLQDEPIQYRTAIELLLYSGMRRGELLGLKWADVDFNACTVSIVRSSLYLPGKGVFEDTTKNNSSYRVIKTSQSVINILHRYKVWQNENRLKLGATWINNDLLFTAWNGEPMHPDTLSAWFSAFVKRKGLPSVHLHSLRHTNASLLIASGINLQTVAKRLGHANPNTTSKIYSHAIQSAEAVAVDALESILNDNPDQRHTV